MALQKRRINPVFHVSLLRAYHVSRDSLFSNRIHPKPYDFGASDEHKWFIDELLGHHWKRRNLEFEVRWSLGDTTWELFENCEELEALDRYLEIQGVNHPAELPQ